MRNANIKSVGAYVPAQKVPNAYFNEQLGEDVDTWLRENVHIYERRWCAEDESTADLVIKAAQETLTKAKLDATDLDMIIVATDTPEFVSPATATKVQHELGAANAAAFDMNNACAGFVYALDVATKFIQADARYRYILVVGAYAMSKYLNKQDKKTVTLFADGAGAVLLEATPNTNQGYLTSTLSTQGQYHEWMGIYAGGSHQPVNHEVIEAKTHQLQFVKKFPPELNPTTWSSMIREMCEQIDCAPTDIDHFFITQININSIWATMDMLNVPRERAHTVMHYFGYTGSACIPMALNEAWNNDKIKSGELICLVGSGGGLSFGGSLFRV